MERSRPSRDDRSRPVLAGVVTALVGFSSSFAVVLAGLRAVGATPAQAGSGLAALCLAQGIGMVVLSWRHRIPITLAWSTPGAALLVSTGAVAGGWPAAVGAFLLVGVLVLATAAWPRLGALVGRIPVPVAQAMLAGVLLTLCLAPVRALASEPAFVVPVVVVWLVLLRLAPRWATPAALGLTLALVVVDEVRHGGLPAASVGHLAWTTPHLGWQAVVGIAVPLFLVTMASQNVPGVAVLGTFGYQVPWRSAMTVTGLGTVLAAPAGGHAVNLAAITAALAASPDAARDPRRRWLATHVAGWCYVALALASTWLASLVAQAPPGVVEAAAGLALLASLGGALHGAFGATAAREPAVVTFVVAASGVALGGVGAAFWALLAGLVVGAVLRRRTPRADEGEAAAQAPHQ
ncbi:benzoate/H(+) symporter BenE family transporter [Luteimicrobium sp. DT211]|uniref:benzoate/H(+) symporter BenE family transporter n=1 Tax=Luteimicrobium sp. DT211 TaxID=3393412 RepID=UPI003CF64542